MLEVNINQLHVNANIEMALLAVLKLKCRKKKLVVLYNIFLLPSSSFIDRSASSFLLPTPMPTYLVSNIQTSRSVGLGVRPTHL
jgi:hypothetical protein